MPKYQSVNSQWPAGTNDGKDLKPTPEEATRAAKRLYRLAMKRPFKGKIKITSGRRTTWIRSGVFYVNPDYRGGGWHELVHMISHYCAFRLHPNVKAHSTQHAFVERELIAHVVKSGWLAGKLAKAIPAPPVDRRAVRRARLETRRAAWTTKAKRAKTALAKITAALKRLDRAQGRDGRGRP